jgi:hypothetical protein
MQYKAQLEQILTSELSKQLPRNSQVTVSFDGQFALYNNGDRFTLRKLSPAAKDFLNNGDFGRIRKTPLFS